MVPSGRQIFTRTSELRSTDERTTGSSAAMALGSPSASASVSAGWMMPFPVIQAMSRASDTAWVVAMCRLTSPVASATRNIVSRPARANR